MQTNFDFIRSKTINLYNITEMEYNKLYNISELELYTDGLNGFVKILGSIRKSDYTAIVKFVDISNELICSINHLIISEDNLKLKVKELKKGQRLLNGNVIESVNLTEKIQDFYDVSVDSEDHLFKTSDGVVHHNTTAIESTLNAMGLYDGDGYFQISGNISSAVAYEALYNNRTGIVLFDDCNSVLDDEAGRAIIKTATDTKKVRKLSYLKRSSRFFDPTKENPPEDLIGIEKFPRSFNFEGRIIFISNLTIDDLDPDRSIRTRVLRIDISPTDSELIDFMESILDKIELNDGLTLSHEKRLECLSIVKNSKRKDDLSIRKLVRTMNLAASGIPGWQQLALLYA